MATPPTTRRIASFEIEEELGHGGMGVVYLARQPALERRVVLKTLRRELSEDPVLGERFTREAQAAARVHHQNVVCVYDCFVWRGERYIAQEYVDGCDLGRLLERTGRLEPQVAAHVALELARGLEEIHAQGLVHRDLKPTNVLLGRAGEVKVADFGIVLPLRGPALTATGHAMGTPPYMSPEQLLGERVDARSDLFSLGVLLYELLAGAVPFEVGDPETGDALLRRIQARRYPRLRRGEPRWLARLIDRLLQPKPRRRPASATEVRRTLEGRLGSPTPAGCRESIARWLEQARLFDRGEQPTRPLPGVHPVPARSRRFSIAAGLLLALLASSCVLIRERPTLLELAPELARLALSGIAVP